MDLIHDVDNKPWIHCEKFKVKQFLSKLINELNIQNELQLTQENMYLYLEKNFNIDKKTIRKIENNCSITKLNIKEEKDFYFWYRSRDCELNKFNELHTLNARKHNLQLFKNNQLYRFFVLDKQKYRTNYVQFNLKNFEKANDSESKIPLGEGVLTVQIFNPLTENNYKDFKKNNFKMHEYHVLSSQYLTSLKDIYICVSDVMSPVDCNENPDTSKSLNKADDYTSNFFFINNTFYIDTRKQSNLDYSEIIREWASKQDRKIGKLDKKILQETKFEDLEIQLGYPYLYLHQGNCEHLIVFTDFRLHSKKYYQYYSSYPCRTATVNKLSIRCNLCELNVAKWIVFENERLPQSPFYFCENCFFTYNYDEHKKPIGLFKAYPYIDNSTVI